VFEWLTPIHAPGGSRDRHDDWPWFISWVPRTWTSFEMFRPPRQIFGNQKYWCAMWTGEVFQDLSYNETVAFHNLVIGPKPLPRPGEWQITKVYYKDRPIIMLWQFLLFVLPAYFINPWLTIPAAIASMFLINYYFAFTTKGGHHFRIGARWTDPNTDQKIKYNYVTYPSVAYKRLKEFRT